MWIFKKTFRARCLEEYQLGLRQGIGIGRNQIRREIIAAAERKRRARTASTPATSESGAKSSQPNS